MKDRHLLPFVAALALAWPAGSTCYADTYISYAGGSATRGVAADNGNLNIGREFTVSGNGIDIQDLGVWDYQGNGLASAHTVTLFSLNTSGPGALATPIPGASVSVPAGAAAPLDSGFRFQSLASPVYLPAGTYAAVAYGLNGSDPYGDGGITPSGVPDVAHAGFDPFQFTPSASPAFPTGGDGNNHSSVSFRFTSTDAPPPPDTRLKIMPLGDSITYGVGGTNAGYREPLDTLLNNAGIPHVFVGSATDNPGTLPADEQHHEGHSGFTITGGGRPGILDNINTWLGPDGADPGIILLMIGTNDVTTYATTLASVPQAAANLDTLLSRISNKTTGLKPDAQLIVAEITPIVNASQDLVVQAYNQDVAALVAAHQALGENVTLVDMHSALTAPGDMSDNLHPNDAGYNKMAQVWLSGIQAVPEPSSVGLILLAGTGLAARRKRRR